MYGVAFSCAELISPTVRPVELRVGALLQDKLYQVRMRRKYASVGDHHQMVRGQLAQRVWDVGRTAYLYHYFIETLKIRGTGTRSAREVVKCLSAGTYP
jgi:hypothetical protein